MYTSNINEIQFLDRLQYLIDKKIKNNTIIVNKLKEVLLKNNKIMGSYIQDVLNGAIPLEGLEFSVLILLTIEVFNITKNKDIDPQFIFSREAITEAKQKDFTPFTDRIDFPVVLQNVLKIDSDNYITTMPISDLIDYYDSQIIGYNLEAQRNPKRRFVKTEDGEGKYEEKINVKQSSVDEIAEKLKNGEFMPDAITLNARVGTNNEGIDEIEYNPKNMMIRINQCKLDVLDGWHRIKAFEKEVRRCRENDTESDFIVAVHIKNFTTSVAQKYVSQINKVNKMNKVHLQRLSAERQSDLVVKELQRTSELKGMISNTNFVGRGELVSYGVLADTIHEKFVINTKLEAKELANYLSDFFDSLIGYFSNEFKFDIERYKEVSIINHNNMFAGYIVLAKAFRENNIPLEKLRDIDKIIDFDRGNKYWQDGTYGKVIYEGKLTKNARKEIINFFEHKIVNTLKMEVRKNAN